MTLITVSIAVHEAEEIDQAIDLAHDAATAGAQLVEWRIDALAEIDDAAKHAQRLVEQSPIPCIVTCRMAREGGEYSGDEQSRAALFEQILMAQHRPRYIDVELAAVQREPGNWKRVRELLANSPHSSDLPTGLILSSHDFNGRPADLLRRVEAMASDPLCAVIKVAWFARSLRDNLEAFDLLREAGGRQKPMIALCMGPFGLMSRVLAPKFGGFLTFAVEHEAEVTAPGQPTITELLKLYRFNDITSQTRVFGVIGWPVSHSLSPAIHNAGFAEVEFDGVYLPLPIPPEYEHFKATVGAMIDHSALNFRGASVTIPHKENLLRFVRERGGRIDALTEQIGAANTLVIGSAGGLECLNTDCAAAIESLCNGMEIDRAALCKKRVAVIGAGGVARAVIAGLIDAGAIVFVFNRSFENATRLVEEIKSREAASGTVSAAALEPLGTSRFEVIINCTLIGMHGGPAPNDLPFASAILDENITVMDTVYTPLRTPLIREAESRGARTISGVDMFVRQAAMQFEKWTGKAPVRASFERVLKSPAGSA